MTILLSMQPTSWIHLSKSHLRSMHRCLVIHLHRFHFESFWINIHNLVLGRCSVSDILYSQLLLIISNGLLSSRRKLIWSWILTWNNSKWILLTASKCLSYELVCRRSKSKRATYVLGISLLLFFLLRLWLVHWNILLMSICFIILSKFSTLLIQKLDKIIKKASIFEQFGQIYNNFLKHEMFWGGAMVLAILN